MKSILAKAQDGTLTLTITIPSDVVKKAWESEVENVVKNATLPGFRKGMAPRKLVEEKLDRAKVQEDVLRALLPKAYADAVSEHSLKPVVSPRIHVEKLEDNKDLPAGRQDWVFQATTTEMPDVTLGDYKKKIKDVTAKSKIVIPGKEEKGPNMDDIVKTLLESVKVTIPSILIEGEVDRLLSQLLDEVKSLGLSLDQYLASTHKTVEQLKEEYTKRAAGDITFEFALQKIAEEEKITVSDKEIDEALEKAKDEAERKNLEKNVYLLASILRQQKTLDFLRAL